LILSVILFIVIKDKTYKPLLNSLAVLAIAGIFAIGVQMLQLISNCRIRYFFQGKSELSFNPDGSKVLLQAR
jgi:hypothetical protein